jgi:RNA polymerase sigma-70 factor (ECF subfamily)
MHGIGRVPATDQELVDALREGGSESAFRELYGRHTPRLLRFVRRVLGRAGDDAEDVVQETWIRAVEGLAGFRGEARIGTWLTGIGLNVARMHLRKLGRWRGFLEVVRPEAGAPALSHEERMDLECVLAHLPDGQRTVLLLHDLEGYTHGEIGEMLGIAEGTSKSQLSAARRQAQALYDGGPPQPPRRSHA